MKIIKKVVFTLFIIASLFIYSTIVRATTTLKVTADTLNLRKKASTNSDVITLLSKGNICELIEETGDWYKVKYNNQVGYVTKEYVKVEKTTEEPKEDDKKTDNNEESKVDETNIKVKANMLKKTDVKLLPLIYSTTVDSINKDVEILVITEINNWSYVQSNNCIGWVRSDSITNKKNITSNQKDVVKEDNNSQDKTTDNNKTTTSDKFTPKTMYVNDSYVNLRKKASTSSNIVMVVEQNTKLTVIGESGEWYQVKTSVGNTYVLKKLLSNKQVTSSRGGTAPIINNIDNEKTVSKINLEEESESKENTNLDKGVEIVSYAKQFLGVPYVYGGASKSGFDCSGFTMYVYRKFGISLKHGAQAQSKVGQAINVNKKSANSIKENLQEGDLIFFLDYETMKDIGHCGIYIGNGNFIHASSGSGYCVKIDSLLPGKYYNTRYHSARRII